MSVKTKAPIYMKRQSPGRDWCHVCGRRDDGNRVEISYPYGDNNAEHGDDVNECIRICEGCLETALAIAKGEREAISGSRSR